ncbi:OmpL47-type beta-barrel domain-containing protein [Sinomonas sp.]|uniref:OmpL47-type beta-barrel domain-containing protein n=1 Tax=Sinomonas sp. TaxID=1914986 RepID=UPI003F822F31
MIDDQMSQGSPRRLLRVGRRSAAALAAVVLVAGSGAAAFAYWQATSTSPDGLVVADTVSQGARPSGSFANGGVSLSWTAGTTAGGRAVSGYTIARYSTASGGAAVAATGGCAGVVSNLSCTETGVPGGTWFYTVTPVLGNWAGAESARSAGVVTDSTPPTVSVASITPTPNAAGYNNSSPVTVSLAAQDNAGGSGVASITYALDGGQPATVSGAGASVSIGGDGTHTLVYSATDAAGNTSANQTLTVRIDTVAPGAPALGAPAVINGANVGAVPISGSAESGSTVTVTASDGSGHSVTGTATSNASGSWSLPTLNMSGLADGTITLKATAQDAAGNVSPATTATALKDTQAPAAPTVTAPATVWSANVASFSVSGSSEASARIALKVTDSAGAFVTGNATADGTGRWSVTGLNLSGLAEGQLTYSATATDAAGNTGAPGTQTGLKDTSSAKPQLTVPATITSDTVSGVQISGTSDPSASVVLTASDSASHSVTATVSANTSGAWTTTMNVSGLNSGPVTFSAQATDPYGNVSVVNTAASRIGPKVVSVALSGTNGKADSGDTVTVVFNEVMSPSSFCSTWTSTTSSLTGNGVAVQITPNNGNDALTVTGCTTASNFGTVYLGATYASGGSLTFKGSGQGAPSQVSLGTDGKTLTITLGALSSSSKGTQAIVNGSTRPAPVPATYSGAVAGQTGAPTDSGSAAVGTTPSGGGASVTYF